MGRLYLLARGVLVMMMCAQLLQAHAGGPHGDAADHQMLLQEAGNAAYTIHVRVIQTKPSAWYRIVEKTVWHYGNGGTWSEVGGEHTLGMGDSGTSGTLRFQNPQGDYFLVALGVHNYQRWCDIKLDLNSSNTGVEIHPTYYAAPGGDPMLWKQLAHLQRTSSKGCVVTVDYYKEASNTYWATITIAN